jgi:transcriptional regulator with XRE-family HTH domain
MKFSELLKEARSKKNMTQKEVAALVGVPLNSYQRWEYGVHVPDGKNILKLIEVLDLEVDDIQN